MHRIKDVYSQALAVFVVDAFLEQTPSPDSPEETLALLVTSPWFSRLWTYSEGSLAPLVSVLFQDSEVKELDHFLERLEEPAYRAMNPISDMTQCWYEVRETIGRLRAIRRLRNRSVQEAQDLASSNYLDNVISSVRHRQTSRKEDEAVCLALSLGLDISLADASSEDAMLQLYSQLKYIPATLLLFSGEKLTAPGYRWAPHTLIGPRDVFRNSHRFDHTVRYPQIGMRIPEGYVVYLLRPIAELSVQPNSDKSRFEWGVSPIKMIYFRLGSTLLYVRVPEDINATNSAAKAIRIPMHVELNHSMAVVMRSNVVSGWLPAAVLDIRSCGRGRAIAESKLETSSAVRQKAHGINPPGTMSQERMPKGSVADGYASPTVAHGDSSLNTKHYLTDFHAYARVYRLAGAEEVKMKNDFDVEAGYEGIEPWDRDRLVCNAEELDLTKSEVWVA
jgi:hypothetical protein